MNSSKIMIAVLCIIVPLVVGAISGFATIESITGWYEGLAKPAFNPPNAVFGPVWTALYILMGISLYLIWQSPKGKARTIAFYIFGIQLLLNFAWSFIFFSFHEIFIALVEIVLIWISIVTMIAVFLRLNRTAAYLQLPYLFWVTFATILNSAIWILN